uniref:Activating signal cointegrator 1 complex subunit 1 n=1 Tax=Parasteatoda tepidariorum TaxID=114398 RepID=A0A2L2YCP3_PARTP
MNILKPELIWIENRCYRKLNVKDNENKMYIEDDMYPVQPNEYNEEEDDVVEDDLPIKYENQKFWISLPVPGELIGYVCGNQRFNIKRIKDSTGAEIKIPSRLSGPDRGGNKYGNERSSDFVITAEKESSVSQAYRMLKEIMNSGRWKIADFTHFISIPVNSDSIQKKFLTFCKAVSQSCPSAVQGAVFTNPSKLHLTICMLTLLDKREMEEAKAALNDCASEITKMLGQRRLELDIKGIEYMNDDDAEVDVLYAKVIETDGSNVLKIIAEKLAETFSNMNLAPRHYSVKLHLTLLKSRSYNEKRSSFDARPILQKFKDYEFGQMEVTEIHISTRHTGHNNKYYSPSALINV